MKRAERRHNLDRMKAKAKRLGAVKGLPGNYGKLYDHLSWCSCPGCGNPRRWFGEPTMQEQRTLPVAVAVEAVEDLDGITPDVPWTIDAIFDEEIGGCIDWYLWPDVENRS